jgi:pilus assembly protein CpaE
VLSSGRQQQSASSQVARIGADGKILTVFSPKGGVGKTTMACALATAFARRKGYRVLLVDLDLQFGDCAIMMGVEPEKTIYDIVMTAGDLDPEKLTGYVSAHPSGVHIVPAPVRPEDAELVAEDRVAHLLEVAKQAYDVIVVDTPTHFHATTLATLDRTDKLVLLASLDIPSVKNVKLTLQTLGLLHYPGERINVVLNRPHAKAEIKRPEVERALDMKAVAEMPYDREVAVAVNRGVPMPMSAPRSDVTKAVGQLADALVPERNRGRRTGPVEAAPAGVEEQPAKKQRQSILKRKAA